MKIPALTVIQIWEVDDTLENSLMETGIDSTSPKESTTIM